MDAAHRLALLALALLLQFFNVSFTSGDLVETIRPLKTWKGPPSNYSWSANLLHQTKYAVDSNSDSSSKKVWNLVDNGHKKKQNPRSVKIEKIGSRMNNYAFTQNSKRTSLPLDQPTLRPIRNFNAREDAEKLRIALRTQHIDEAEIINIMTRRTDDQRQEIVKYYPDLKADLSWKLSFGFRELMKALASPLHEFHAEQLHEVFRNASKLNDELLIELLLYEKDIKDELRGFSSNFLANLLISYIEVKRNEKSEINSSLAKHDAQKLQKAGTLRIEESAPLRKILLTRSYPQLKQTFSEYKSITGTNIRDAIRRDFSKSVQKGLLNIVKAVSNRPQYFAEILNAGIRNFSKRDATLIRVILLRSESDMGDIKTSYFKLYNLDLSASIPTNTGSLKKALISLISG
ncbi:Annexin [Gryllus bimaculatus]|nr:Annexin [Gryllus bimaculatus]